MTNGVTLVVTRKSGVGIGQQGPFRVSFVKAYVTWCGYPRPGVIRLKTRTTILTDLFQMPRRSSPLLTIDGREVKILPEDLIKVSCDWGVGLDARDEMMCDPSNWVWSGEDDAS